MAHYITLHDSRFRRSHDYSFVPVFGLEKFLDDEEMVMTFKKVGKVQKAVHRYMDFTYRPTAFEHMCAYEFFEQIEVDYKSKYPKEQEHFELQEAHPLAGNKVATYRRFEAVPVFGWSWLPSTEGLGSLLEPVSESHPFWEKREEYCKRFLILFYPFRDRADLLSGGVATYQEKFREVVPYIDERMLEVANNIQNISNSLRSKMPDNILLDSTDLEEEIAADKEHQSNREDNDYTSLLSDMQSYLTSIGGDGSDNMTEEATAFEPKFVSYSNAGQISTSSEDAFAHAEAASIPDDVNRTTTQRPECRWRTTTDELNTLLMTTRTGTTENQCTTVDGSAESIIQYGKDRQLDPEQQLAFQIITATYVLTFYEEAASDPVLNFPRVEEEKEKLNQLAKPLNPESTDHLRLFVTGPAGAGKSAILQTMLAYCKQFSRNINHVFDDRTTIVMTSLTGSSAVSIGGDTTARVFGLRQATDEASQDEKMAFIDTRLCIIDEAGFMKYRLDLEKLSGRLQSITECRERKPFGSMHLVFLGDFHQLEPVGGDAIYEHKQSLFWESTLNCMVELHGTHRFQNCPVFSKLMPALRKGEISTEMRDLLNSRIVDGDKVKMPTTGELKYATYYNKTRADLNASAFKDYLKKNHSEATPQSVPKTAIVIKSNLSWSRNSNHLTPEQRQIFFQECDESINIDSNKKRADPFLCLYSGCGVMISDNIDVANGIANGTTAKFRKAILKEGATPSPIQVHQRWVNAIDIDDVDHLVLEWVDCDPFYTGTFKLYPKRGPYSTKYPIREMGVKSKVKARVYITHFPLLLNTATTGHKLQGKSVDILIVAEWHTALNWAYVVLSRVRSLDGLYLLKKIPDKIDFQPNANCVAMMDRLRSTILVTPPTN
jgi:6-pyruvoyl-tetrahydropterin synthase